jgi:hypothetical protein
MQRLITAVRAELMVSVGVAASLPSLLAGKLRETTSKGGYQDAKPDDI